jgi:hypothetical protein
MSDAWYYAEGDNAVGPITLVDLKKRLIFVSNAKDVLVWRAGFANWQSAGSVFDLALLPAQKPPPIPQSVGGRIARGLLSLFSSFLAGFAIYFFIRIFMPQIYKMLQEMGQFWFWVSLGSGYALAAIAVNVLARFLPPKAWEKSGKFLILWILTLIGFVVVLRSFDVALSWPPNVHAQ